MDALDVDSVGFAKGLARNPTQRPLDLECLQGAGLFHHQVYFRLSPRPPEEQFCRRTQQRVALRDLRDDPILPEYTDILSEFEWIPC